MPGERFGGLVGAGQGSSAKRRACVAIDVDPVAEARDVPELPRAAVADVGEAWSGPAMRSRRRTGGGAVFRAGAIADRGPMERGSAELEQRARDARELERQAEWRASANRAMSELIADEAEVAEEYDPGPEQGRGSGALDAGSGPDLGQPGTDLEPDATTASRDEEESLIRLGEITDAQVRLEPMNVLGYGISKKRLEQAIKDLQLPVVVVREPDEADVVITLRSSYKQKSPIIREAESRGIPIYVLKSNTVVQMQAILTSLYVLDTDPARRGHARVGGGHRPRAGASQAGRAVAPERLSAQAAAPGR